MEGSIAVPMLVDDLWRPWSCQTRDLQFERRDRPAAADCSLIGAAGLGSAGLLGDVTCITHRQCW